MANVTVQSVVQKTSQKTGKPYFILVIDGAEYMSFDTAIKNYAGKTVELELSEKDGRKYARLPGSAKPTGGGGSFRSYGKSEAELDLQAKTMTAAYAKDLVVALITSNSLIPAAAEEMFLHFFNVIYFKITGQMEPKKNEPKKSVLAPTPITEPTTTERAEAEKKVQETFGPGLKTEPAPGIIPTEKFAETMNKEMNRIGMMNQFKALEEMGYKYADEIPEDKRQQVLDVLAKMPTLVR